MRDDTTTERRLANEARTINLGTLTHADIPARAGQCARVEVTYQVDEDADEQAGFFVVWTPIDCDPWEESREMVMAEGTRRWPDAAYFSVDDILSY